MSAPLQPLGDYVLALKDKPAEKTKGGLYLPESAKQKSEVATVAAVGDAVKRVKKGDRIIYLDEYAPANKTLSVNGVEYLLVKEENVIATAN